MKMLYSNIDCEVKDVEMSFGVISAITFGEVGAKRHRVILPAPEGLRRLVTGRNPRLKVGASRNGKPRLAKCYADDDDNIFLLLSSEIGTADRGTKIGSVWKHREGYDKDVADMRRSAPGCRSLEELCCERKDYLEKGWGLRWAAYLLKAEPGDMYMVQRNGSSEPVLYIINSPHDIVALSKSEVPDYFRGKTQGVPMTNDGLWKDFFRLD